ncbi:MAG: hypothetical protein WCT85_01145 [Parachlamydiales bacterium]|jgi:hypothetical protein
MKKLLIICMLLGSSLFANEEYYLMFEKDFSSYTGAEDVLTFHESIEYLMGKMIRIPKKRNVTCFLSRGAEMIFVWGPLSRFELVTQHEVFGHGYRIRDINSGIVKVKRYILQPSWPYGDGSGATYYKFRPELTSFGEMAISLAGVDSTAILANRLKMKWISDLRLDPKKASLYIQAQQDLTAYAYSMDDEIIFNDDGHDIESYLYWLNNTYYEDNLSKTDLKRACLINFLDPMTYYCMYSYLNYLISGRDISIPTIKIKNVRFLPNFRLGLAPYGIEYYLENFISYKSCPIYTYLKMGKHNGEAFWGLGLEYPNVYKFNKNKFGFRVDFFRQPKIYLNGGWVVFNEISVGFSNEELKKMINGVSSYLIYERKLFDKLDISLHSELGYKTSGFLPGQSLKNAWIFRLGLGFSSF